MARRTNKGSKDIKITQSEILRELEQYRETKMFSPEIDEIILKGRNQPLKVSYADIARIIEKHFGFIFNGKVLSNRYNSLKSGNRTGKG